MKVATQAIGKSAAKAKKTIPKAQSGGNKGEDTKNVILVCLFEMYELGATSVKEELVLKKTGYARADSKGYRIPLKELTKELGYVAKKSGCLELTEEGVRAMEASSSTRKPTTNEEAHKFWKEKIRTMAKAPEKAIHAFWEVLDDGEAHQVDELLSATGYKRTDSAGFKQIMKYGKQFGLWTKEKGGYIFTAKVFPFGHPAPISI